MKSFECKYEECTDILSERKYNLIIGGALLWGFLINLIIVNFFADVFLSLSPIVILVGYLVIGIAGVFVAHSSKNPVITFIGYNMVVIPIGAVLSVCLVNYDPVLILKAIMATSVVSLIMMVLSTIYPKVFLSLGKVLFIGLIASLIVEIIFIFCGFSLAWIDWIVAIIFSGYIGYDWVRANSRSRTINNALLSVLSLYLDIINLFLRLLRILGRSSSSSD